MPLPYKHHLIPRAKQLRNYATKQENHLWYDFLNRYPVRFQRQKSIDNFIVDFYCYSAKLVIELDGGQHYTSEEIMYDQDRTFILEKYQLKVIRFSNNDINQNFRGVCEQIDKVVKERINLTGS